MGKHLWLRNTLVMIGAYYLASVADHSSFWLLISKLDRRSFYQGAGRRLVMHALNMIPSR